MAPDEQAAINLSLSLTAIFYILLSLLVCGKATRLNIWRMRLRRRLP